MANEVSAPVTFTAEGRRLADRILALGEAARRATEVTMTFVITYRAFAQAVERHTERLWLATHRRLPGSLRTKRLRKKRRTRLLAALGES